MRRLPTHVDVIDDHTPLLQTRNRVQEIADAAARNRRRARLHTGLLLLIVVMIACMFLTMLQLHGVRIFDKRSIAEKSCDLLDADQRARMGERCL